MLATMESTRPIEEVARDLERFAPEHGLSVLGQHDLAGRMTEKGFQFETPVRVLEVCSAKHAHQVLSARIEIATAMPCRVALWGTVSGTVLATLEPTKLLPMFGDASLAPVAAEIERRILELMRHAAEG
jgi:uncharacterized protein (DUF302 family)